MAVECNEFFSIYKKQILHQPHSPPLVSPPCPSIPPDPSGELFPAFAVVFMDASHAGCCSDIFLIPPPPPAMIKGVLFRLTTNVPPPPPAVFELFFPFSLLDQQVYE